MTKKKQPLPPAYLVAEAALHHVRATAALRDAKRLLDAGYAAHTKENEDLFLRVREAAESPGRRILLPYVISLLIAKRANEYLELYDGDPGEWPQGRTSELAHTYARKNVLRAYGSGKCLFCKRPALPCALRDLKGEGCA